MSVIKYIKDLFKIEFQDIGLETILMLDGEVIMRRVCYQTFSPTRVVCTVDATTDKDGRITEASIHSVYEALKLSKAPVSIAYKSINEVRVL